jgi:hypothetical protein
MAGPAMGKSNDWINFKLPNIWIIYGYGEEPQESKGFYNIV